MRDGWNASENAAIPGSASGARPLLTLNAERFYSDLGYSALERTEVVLPNDHRMAAVVMGKDL